ncbi:hypothetical protein [Algoriphagus boritolerans]|uniref:DUF2846 domain-containing protein n=1 Tax=Algoriphagus boritolerans DSM 17298 = JCM 18970 TaxID=1120964 RepID=A0A1H5ZGP4_9BACT|nr:hypothetical protein [Algoriphagus boritolerans]SEG35442.1 hypothetical protein SAMN03080598_03501 [Algoriphagus boritolerans DSM 17298 = JCM 18970]
MKELVYLGWFLILLCIPRGSLAQETSSDSSEAILVIYRKPHLNFTAFRIYGDETILIPDVKANSYYLIKRKPGRIFLKTEGSVLRNLAEKREYSLTLEAGKTYYLEAILEYQFLLTSLHLVKRSEVDGAEAIRKMKGIMIDVKQPMP